MSALDPAVYPTTISFEGGALDDRTASRSPNGGAPARRTTSQCEANGCELLAEIGSDYCAFHECLPDVAETADLLFQFAEIHLKQSGAFAGGVFTLRKPRQSPTCGVCGKKSKGHGLCANHLSQSYRRRIGKVTGKHVRNRRPSCHPDRKHKAFGLCSMCHQRRRARRAA